MSAAEPVAPAGLQVVTTLLSSTIPLNIGIPEGVTDKIRFFLFFLIAYCDTFHDFSSNRPIKGEGKSVSKEDVGNRADFVKNIIKQMEPEIQEYIIKNWEKYSSLEGFYMTNIRSSRSNFIQGKKNNNKPIWFESDIESELNEGINEKSKIRINLCYKDGETDPSNYKFIVRRFKGTKQATCSNTTMYNA